MDERRRERRRGGSRIREYEGVIANEMDEGKGGKFMKRRLGNTRRAGWEIHGKGKRDSTDTNT